jgi:hypothetical protein
MREGTYRIDSQPNLNQMLVTRSDAIRQVLTLVALDPERSWEPAEAGQRKARGFVEAILSSAGSTFRQFQKVLAFVAPTSDGVR